MTIVGYARVSTREQNPAAQEAELRGVLDQLLQLAAQNGVTGRISVGAPVQEEREET